ncbi:MAG: HAD family phosphatase [Planctomycetaceae bacterium]|nr:HAD family phosphatase [Planctomycetaceae bacterium]
MHSVKAVLFDLDGTLVDTEELHLQAWRDAVMHYGHTFPKGWEYDYIGNPDIDWARHCVHTFANLPPVDRLLDERHARYRELLSMRGRPCTFVGVKEELAELVRDGIHIGIGTNSTIENTRAALHEGGIAHFFQVVIAYGMTPSGKPSPDIYLAGMKELGVHPHESAVIEDSPAGIAAGKAAGAYVIGVATTHPAGMLAQADTIFLSTVEALRCLRARNYSHHVEKERNESV